jgi:hypothetical protein
MAAQRPISAANPVGRCRSDICIKAFRSVEQRTYPYSYGLALDSVWALKFSISTQPNQKRPYLFAKQLHMKAAFIFLASAALFVACCKEDKAETENHCPVIAASAVPQAVKDSFALRYPSLHVNAWFFKDGNNYCAYFIEPINQKKLAMFSANGIFLSEEVDLDRDGNFEDSTSGSGPKSTTGCECEIPD